MVGKVTRLYKRSKGKKADRLTKAERWACLAERQGQWTQQWIALAEALYLLNNPGEPRAEFLHPWSERARSSWSDL